MKKQNTLLILLIIVSAFLIGSSIALTSLRGVVLNYEASKNNLLTFDLTYAELLSKMQYNSKKYLQTNDTAYRETFYEYMDTYIQRESRIKTFLVSGFDIDNTAGLALPSLTPSNEVPATPSDNQDFVFDDYELSYYNSFSDSYSYVIHALDDAVTNMHLGVFYDDDYVIEADKQYALMVTYTNHYLNRISGLEAPCIKLETFLTWSTPILAFVAGILALIVMAAGIRRNNENAYFRKLFRETLDKTNIGVAILTNDTHYEYANDMYKGLMHVPNAELIGRTPYDILDPELIKILPPKEIKNYQTPILQIPFEHDNRYIAYTRFEIIAGKNETKVVTVIRDCTESIEMDAQLKAQLADIEYYANAKDSFIANVSHEIKTPLNAIIGLVHILGNTDLSEKQKQLVSKVSSASELLLSILNDVLDLSKIKKGLTLYPIDVHFSSILNEVDILFRSIIEGKHLVWSTEYNFAPELCLNIDKIRLSQILINLLNNACKFTAEGNIKLSVDVMDQEDNNIVLRFCVSDTGLGIDPLDLPKLFQEFEQLENHLTKQHQGTGLGLSICKNIAEAMGGKIWAESEKDKGSRFYFTINAQIATAEFRAIDGIATTLPPLDGEGKKVLIVEDTEINFEVTQTLLSEANILCDYASDGIEALHLCKSVPKNYYQAILMDIHMPNMDGYTASEILKTEMGIKSPILALTATNVDHETREKYKGIIDTFILKPFKCADLYMSLYPYFHPELISVPLSNASVSASDSFDNSSQDPLAGRAAAIENLGGMETLYNKHLAKFQRNYKDMGAEIEKIIATGDFDEARRLVHSVKGLAGTLGLLPLQRASLALEEAIVSREDKLLPLIITFENKLKQACEVSSEIPL